MLCTEITQRVIQNVSEAITWLKGTFFYIRVHKNPTRYGFGNAKSSEELERLLEQLCVR